MTQSHTLTPYRVKREGQSHHVVVGHDDMPVYETTRLELARRECRRLNKEAKIATLANPEFAAAVERAMNPQQTIDALVAALRDAIDSLEYVDLAHPALHGLTGMGVRADRIKQARAALKLAEQS